MNKISLPIDHISYSALRSFCSNQQNFFKHYILRIYDEKSSPSMVVGKCAHHCLDVYYKTGDFEKGVKEGMDLMDKTPSQKIDFGKTGSREKMIKDYHQALQFYRHEKPDLGKVIATEDVIVTDKGFDGLLPLPIKVVSDVVSERNGKLVISDYKFTDKIVSPDEENANFIVQAMFNYIGVKAKYNKEPDCMDFIQIKKSRNSDGSPQVVIYTIDFKKHPEYQSYFNQLYADVLYTIADPNHKYLPNFGDMLNGEASWKDYTSEIVDQSSLKKVSHMSHLQKSERMVQFVESSLESDQTLSNEDKIRVKLQEFGIPVQMEETYKGLNVTLYTMKPSRGIRMSQFLNHAPDVALALEAKSVRVQAPIPGTGLVGFEISNEEQGIAKWSKDVLNNGTLKIPVGVDVYGKTTYLDLSKAPHLMIGGTTGSGKSVFMNVLISTLIKQNTSDDLQLVLIDPKRTEFSNFSDEKHLVGGVITETEDADITLEWAVEEMERRYKQLQRAKLKTIQDYRKNYLDMPYIIIVIDELADLMLSGDLKANIEKKIVRLAQKARAVGIHLVVATQRPSVDVITGLIKANFPSRVSFMVSSSTDSRVILDEVGAEKLMGNGDLLLMNPRNQGLERLQGYYLD